MGMVVAPAVARCRVGRRRGGVPRRQQGGALGLGQSPLPAPGRWGSPTGVSFVCTHARTKQRRGPRRKPRVRRGRRRTTSPEHPTSQPRKPRRTSGDDHCSAVPHASEAEVAGAARERLSLTGGRPVPLAVRRCAEVRAALRDPARLAVDGHAAWCAAGRGRVVVGPRGRRSTPRRCRSCRGVRSRSARTSPPLTSRRLEGPRVATGSHRGTCWPSGALVARAPPPTDTWWWTRPAPRAPTRPRSPASCLPTRRTPRRPRGRRGRRGASHGR